MNITQMTYQEMAEAAPVMIPEQIRAAVREITRRCEKG